jgi:hypothetical protein
MSKSKGINQNQLIVVLSGLEHTLREGSNSVETYRDDSLSGISIDTDELRELLKRLKDALRFTKRCIKEYESVVLAPDDVDSLDDSEDDDEEMETEEGDDEDDESDTYLFQQKPNCMPCCNSPSHNVEEVEDDEEDDDEEPAWCTECSTTHAGDCDSGEEE